MLSQEINKEKQVVTGFNMFKMIHSIKRLTLSSNIFNCMELKMQYVSHMCVICSSMERLSLKSPEKCDFILRCRNKEL